MRGTSPAGRPWSGCCFWLIAIVVAWDEFAGIAWLVHNTFVASRSQMCVQYGPSTEDHSDLGRRELGIRSSWALPSEDLLVRILWLKHIVSVKSSHRAEVHVGVEAIKAFVK